VRLYRGLTTEDVEDATALERRLPLRASSFVLRVDLVLLYSPGTRARGRALCGERATRIELAFSAWEAGRRPLDDLRFSVEVLVTGFSGSPVVTADDPP